MALPEQPIELGRGVRRHYVPTLKWRLRRFWSRLPPESRFFKRSTYYRSARATAYGWTLAALIPVGLLGGLGYLIGRGTASLHWPQPWQALAVTAAKPAVAPFLAFLIALLIAWWCRLARLAWLTWKPGEIVVPDFEEGTDVAAGTAKQLTGVFRNRLAELRLQSAAPTPGAAQATDFVDVLDSSSVSSADTLKTVLTLLRAAFPSHAIEVQGMLRQRSVRGPDKYGVVVQAVFLQGQASRVLERWGISWECVLEQAADEITAEILPRTRACRGPWAAWRGYQMPTALIATYEDAAEHEEDGHYDAALDRYAAVLKLDPTNVEVRLRLGQLEEKLGLFLKALASYQSIQSLTHPGAKNLPRGLYRRGARREWERVVRIAQYRELALLGEGSIVGQWSRTKRGEELPGRERRALWKEFETHLRPLTTPRNDPVSDAISQGIVALLSAEKTLNKAAERELVLTLRRWAYQGFEALRRSLPMVVLHPGDEPLTRTTVGLSMACIRLRFDLLAAIVDPDYQPRVADGSLPDLLNKQVAWAGGRPGPWTHEWAPPRLRRRWHDVYNAACLYAIPLNRPYAATLQNGVDEELAKRAVAYLERASACADSSFLHARRDWVLERDRDLTGLRRRPEFETFVDVYFPDEAPPRWREGSRERLVESQYTRRLLVALGESFHETWHKRAHDAWEVHKVQEWYEEELGLWMLLADVAHRAFDWRRRIRLQNYATELLIRHDQTPPDVSFATPANGALITRPAANGRPRNELRANRRRLSELDGLLRNDYGRNRTCFDNWLRLLRGYDADSRSSLSDADLEDLCHHQAAVWQALADWMGGSTGGFGTFRQELREASASRTRMVAKVNGR